MKVSQLLIAANLAAVFAAAPKSVSTEIHSYLDDAKAHARDDKAQITKRGQVTSKSVAEAQNVEIQLKNFAAHLQYFVNETTFDVVAFSAEVGDLEEKWNRLRATTESLRHRPKSLKNQLRFTNHIFSTFWNFWLDKWSFTLAYHPERLVNYRISELNIRIFCLLDSSGQPNLGMRGYREKLDVITEDVAYYTMLFHESGKDPGLMPQDLQDASKTIAELRRQSDLGKI